MRPASAAAPVRDAVRMLVADGDGELSVRSVTELPILLDCGDVVVVNDAATMPASVMLTTARGEALEARIARLEGHVAIAYALGAGDWRTDTLERLPPPSLAAGETLLANGQPFALVRAENGRRLELSILADEPMAALYAHGRPVQYSYIEDDLELWSVQTAYASRPVASEMPSAGRPLSWEILLALRRKGVVIARVTHAAGLSTTGDPDLDATLPGPEWSEVPADTAAAIAVAKARGKRVIAIGTSVVRALESATLPDGRVRSARGFATLRINAKSQLRTVEAIVTGLHDEGTSHCELLSPFASAAHIEAAWSLGRRSGLRAHELGDVAFIAAPTAKARVKAVPRRPKSSSVAAAAAMVR